MAAVLTNPAVPSAASVETSTGLELLCVAITGGLILALVCARWVAGLRSGETREQARAATSRVAVAAASWLALTGLVAGLGWLDRFDGSVPPLMPLLVLGFALVFVLAFSRTGRCLAEHLPLWLLVGFQGFRVAVEIMLHRASREGVIGAQMTWSGLNYDVVTGATAILLGLWLWRRGEQSSPPRGLLWTWNILGLGLLATIVAVSLMSTPGPLRQFGDPPNVWIARLPFVWLPTVMVTAALLGHLLVIRRLRARRS